MITENAELRSELDATKKTLSSAEMELEILKDQILDKIEDVLKVEKEKNFATDKLANMQQNYKETKEELDILTEQLSNIEFKLKAEHSKNDKFVQVTHGLAALHEKMKVAF